MRAGAPAQPSKCMQDILYIYILRGYHKLLPGPEQNYNKYDTNSSFYLPYGPQERFVKAPLS